MSFHERDTVTSHHMDQNGKTIEVIVTLPPDQNHVRVITKF